MDHLSESVRKVCYMTNGPKPDVLMPRITPMRFLDDIIKFDVREDDTFLITYPKCGTTWMQRILTQIIDKSGPAAADESGENKHIFKRVPFLELSVTMNAELIDSDRGQYELAAEMDSPRLLKSHLPPQFLPSQIEQKKPKVVYVARDPRDVAVSYYNFTRFLKSHADYDSWDHFFQDFCSCYAPRGTWFENVVYWWEKRHEENVFFITYEEMQQDIRGAVVRVAQFLGKNLPDDVIDEITKLSSFDSMKSNPKTNPDSLPGFHEAVRNNISFYRKGQVGDWKNHFTVAQKEIFDNEFREKLSKSGLDQLYQL